MPTSSSIDNCPICQSDQFWKIPFNKSGVNRNESRLKNYEWRLCKDCAAAYPSPAPRLAELQAYWDQNRIETSEGQVTEQVWEVRQAQDLLWAQRAYEFVKPYVDNEQITYLDVACGLGATVEYFQSHGWDAEGIDADPNTKEFHLKRNIRSRIGQIENIDDLVKFDLISICHAIYFITEPVNFISRVKSLLKNRGLFLIILSDLSSTLSSGQPGFAHTWYPSQQSLSFLLSQGGFQIVASKKFRGSILILSKIATANPPIKLTSYPLVAYFTHLSQRTRFFCLGKPLLFISKRIRQLLHKIR